MTARLPATAILLAAGLSSRMGTPKPLLAWCGRPLVAYQVAQLQAAGADPVVVVTGHEAAAVEAALAGLCVRIVRNTAYREGRATSLRAAARALADTAAPLALLNVDQPRHATTIRLVLDAHAAQGCLITVPAHAGRRGHPVVLSGALLPELRELSEESEGLRAVMRRHAAERREIPTATDEVLLDLNDPAAYARALSAWSC